MRRKGKAAQSASPTKLSSNKNPQNQPCLLPSRFFSVIFN
jgi:hypothetical protein